MFGLSFDICQSALTVPSSAHPPASAAAAAAAAPKRPSRSPRGISPRSAGQLELRLPDQATLPLRPGSRMSAILSCPESLVLDECRANPDITLATLLAF